MKYTKAEKIKIVKKVSEDFKTGEYTLESCCNNAGVPVRTFTNWFHQFEEYGSEVPEKEKYFAELAELYARARERVRKQHRSGLIERMDNVMNKLVSGYDVEETHTDVKEKVDGDGQKILVPVGMKKIKKHIPPNVGLIQFLLQRLNPEEFGDKSTITNLNVDVSKYDNMSDEELEAEIQKVQAGMKKV